jgi:hypothetical protein
MSNLDLRQYEITWREKAKSLARMVLEYKTLPNIGTKIDKQYAKDLEAAIISMAEKIEEIK